MTATTSSTEHTSQTGNGPHSGAIVAATGVPLSEARAAMIMIHGRGDSASGIIGLADAFSVPGVAYVALQATSNVWYPYPFMSALEVNQPWLDSALAAIAEATTALTSTGMPLDRVVLLGFSQGACLASEYAARHPRRYGGVVALSGGLIGPEIEEGRYVGDLDGTPSFFGCSDVDPHIPIGRVTASADLFRSRGAAVEQRTYPGFGHSVNQDEVDWVHELLVGLAG